MQMKRLWVAWVLGSSSAFATVPAGQIFLGEAYPSGFVYLQAFDEDGEATLDRYPNEVKVFCLLEQGCADAVIGRAPRTAKRVEITKKFPPSLEGMDDRLDASCSWKTKMQKGAKYADGEDFFNQMSDYCDTGAGFGKFKLSSPAKGRAYRVLAVATGATVESPSPTTKETTRPASADEKKAIAKQKKELKGQECTTEPAFLDQAKVLWTGKEAGTQRTWRISSYTNPGCGGHLATIYVLDIIRDGKVQSTHELVRSQGLL